MTPGGAAIDAGRAAVLPLGGGAVGSDVVTMRPGIVCGGGASDKITIMNNSGYYRSSRLINRGANLIIINNINFYIAHSPEIQTNALYNKICIQKYI